MCNTIWKESLHQHRLSATCVFLIYVLFLARWDIFESVLDKIKHFMGFRVLYFFALWEFYFLLFLCLVVLFPWVYVFYTYFFFNVYTWSSPIKIVIDFEIFLWNSYSLIFVFHQGHVIYVSVFRESFLYFFRKKNITTFFIFIIPFCQMYIYNRKILSDFNTTEYIHYL